MNEPQILTLAVITLIGTILTPLLVFFLIRRLAKRSGHMVPLSRFEGHARHRCPACNSPMESGFVVTGRGLHWIADLRRAGVFSLNLGTALENTLNLTLSLAGNPAWRCPSCKLLLLDYSRLVRKDRG